jgi:hypothetical protein
MAKTIKKLALLKDEILTRDATLFELRLTTQFHSRGSATTT